MFFRQNPTALSDQELVSQFKESGELTLLSELFGRYTTMIYGVCLQYLKDRDDAKDAVMQLFEKLTTTLKSHEVNHFKSWVYVTARNHCLMQIRSKKGKFTEEFDASRMENDLILHLEDEPALEDDLHRLEKCIEVLPEEQKQCVRMFFIEEKCYKDIAEVTSFEMKKVKSYIQNGKRNLRICMESHA